MKIEDIEIHVGKVDFRFTPVRMLEAKCEASTAFSEPPSIDAVNAKLREMAVSVGANAVIDVDYNSGISWTSWKSMKGTGLAVFKESDDVACPFCAEIIKRAAIKCRHCGAIIAQEASNVTQNDEKQETKPDEPASLAPRSLGLADPTSPSILGEPLKATNNPQYWVIAVAALFVVGLLVTLSGR